MVCLISSGWNFSNIQDENKFNEALLETMFTCYNYRLFMIFQREVVSYSDLVEQKRWESETPLSWKKSLFWNFRIFGGNLTVFLYIVCLSQDYFVTGDNFLSHSTNKILRWQDQRKILQNSDNIPYITVKFLFLGGKLSDHDAWSI